jgi:hypothetical protein
MTNFGLLWANKNPAVSDRVVAEEATMPPPLVAF